MTNQVPSLTLKTSKAFILMLFLLLVVSNCFSQWKTAEANNIKNDIVITYEVIYDRELSFEEKKSPEYFSEIKVAFNKNNLIERKFGNKSQTAYSFLNYNFNTLKTYACTVEGSSKQALQFDFTEPSYSVELLANAAPKTIVDFPCEKGKVIINGKAKDIYYTKKIGLRYCRKYKIDGFLLEYPAYSKTLGAYTAKAKEITYNNDLPDSFFSLDGFSIKTPEDIKKAKQERLEEINEIRMNYMGEKADTFKALSLTNKKIDTKKLLGDVIVYNFWFTTCGPCKAEIPKLNKLKEKYKGKKVHFIAIATDQDYKIISFLNRTRLNYDIIPEGTWISEKFGVHAYPTNIIVDKNGTVQFYEIGYKDDIVERMSSTLDKYLAE